MQILRIFLLSLFSILLFSCQQSHAPESPAAEDLAAFQLPKAFGEYWYQGEAEVNSYRLEQARYGALHPGHAVLVFVTEGFSREQQVKLDNPQAAGKDNVTVMKLNFMKEFNTGIYQYSLMQSVFTPVELNKYPRSLKTSMSSQDWCGHTFTQLNLEDKGYRVTGLSYFEEEGDQTTFIPEVWLEDEIWTRIRIAPETLPEGEIQIMPGSFYLRLRHQPLSPVTAQVSKQVEGDVSQYMVVYPAQGRSLRISYQTRFPHKILGWEETFRSGWGEGSQELTTRASLVQTLQNKYWQLHSPADTVLREKLGIE